MKTPITYYGGKQTMLKHIRPLIPKHNIYIESFAGGAAVFFDKEPAKVNVINDLNGELVNFYATITTHYDELKNEIAKTLHCRNQHAHAWHVYNNPDFFTNVQRAWAVFLLSKSSFAGRLDGSFGFEKSESRTPIRVRCAKELINDDLKTLLENATIECDDALKVVKRYDSPAAWHFMDPPYIGSNMGHYGGMFNEQNLVELLELCATLKGKFMLTMYPNEIIKQHAEKHGWVIHAVERPLSACKASSRRKQEEWMVCNYNLNQL